MGRSYAQEQSPGPGTGASTSQVRHDRLTYHLRKRKRVQAAPLSPDQNLAPRPIEIIQGQRCRLDSSQAETQHKDHHGIVTPPDACTTIAGEQEPVRFFRGQSLGQSRPSPGEGRQ